MVLGALVAGHHAGGHAHGAHHEDEGAAVVLAEARPALEQEFVDTVLAQLGGRQRVVEGFLADPAQHVGGQHVGIVAQLLAPLSGQRQGTRVEARRQLQPVVQAALGLVQPRPGAGARLRHKAHPFGQRRLAHPFHRGQHGGGFIAHLRGLGDGVQPQQPAVVAGLSRDGVLPCGRSLRHAHLGWRQAAFGRGWQGRPASAVEVAKAGAAPVHVAGGGRFALEFHPHHDFIGFGQLREVAGGHRVRQAGGAGVLLVLVAPQRPARTREQHEQDDGQRQGLQQQHDGLTQPGAQRHLGLLVLDGEQHRQQRRNGQQRPGAHQDALGVQIGGQQQEEAQEDRDVEVAPGAHLQKLQPQKEHDQRHARFLTHQGAELGVDRAYYGQTGQDADPAPRQGPAGNEQAQPPGKQDGKARRAPEGQVQGMGQDGQQRHGQQEERVAPVAFPGAAQATAQRAQRGAQTRVQGGVFLAAACLCIRIP